MTDLIRLTGKPQREYAKRKIDAAPDGWFVSISEPTRTLDQNAKLHPMLEDIRRQVPGMNAFSRDDMKLRFLNALGSEGRFLPVLEGEGVFPVGQRSSLLSKSQFSDLIELLYEYGARNGVRWSEPGQAEAA